jgi:hypothetical protein
MAHQNDDDLYMDEAKLEPPVKVLTLGRATLWSNAVPLFKKIVCLPPAVQQWATCTMVKAKCSQWTGKGDMFISPRGWVPTRNPGILDIAFMSKGNRHMTPEEYRLMMGVAHLGVTDFVVDLAADEVMGVPEFEEVDGSYVCCHGKFPERKYEGLEVWNEALGSLFNILAKLADSPSSIQLVLSSYKLMITQTRLGDFEEGSYAALVTGWNDPAVAQQYENFPFICKLYKSIRLTNCRTLKEDAMGRFVRSMPSFADRALALKVYGFKLPATKKDLIGHYITGEGDTLSYATLDKMPESARLLVRAVGSNSGHISTWLGSGFGTYAYCISTQPRTVNKRQHESESPLPVGTGTVWETVPIEFIRNIFQKPAADGPNSQVKRQRKGEPSAVVMPNRVSLFAKSKKN